MTDLHMHSKYSDGKYSPVELIAKCAENNLKTVSLTDHDTLAGVTEASEEAKKHQILFIPGVELSCETDREIHILGYHIDNNHEPLLNELELIRDERRQRTEKMVQKLRDAGLNITYEDVVAEAKGESIGRPHIGAALVKKGLCPDLFTAFQSYLGRGARAYVKRVKLTPEKAIRLITEAGGIPVLAHPLLTGLADIRPLIRELMQYGLKGIEAYYPAHTDGQCIEYESIAMQNKLLITIGSDFHGEGYNAELGSEKRKSDYLYKCIEYIAQYNEARKCFPPL